MSRAADTAPMTACVRGGGGGGRDAAVGLTGVVQRRAFSVWAAAAGALALAGCAGPAPRSSAAPAPPLPAEQSSHIVLTAMAFLDVSYRYGGSGGKDGKGAAGAPAADGFDCSGFTRHVYDKSLGVALPRTSAEQARAAGLVPVGAGDLQPGDLVFFNTLNKAFSHVGIYAGEGRFIHAPRTGTRVRLEEMNGAAGRYWTQRFDGARRPVAAAIAAAMAAR